MSRNVVDARDTRKSRVKRKANLKYLFAKLQGQVDVAECIIKKLLSTVDRMKLTDDERCMVLEDLSPLVDCSEQFMGINLELTEEQILTGKSFDEVCEKREVYLVAKVEAAVEAALEAKAVYREYLEEEIRAEAEADESYCASQRRKSR